MMVISASTSKSLTACWSSPRVISSLRAAYSCKVEVFSLEVNEGVSPVLLRFRMAMRTMVVRITHTATTIAMMKIVLRVLDSGGWPVAP